MATSYIAPTTQGLGDGTSAENARGYSLSNLALAEIDAGNDGIVFFVDGTYTLTTGSWCNDASGPDTINYKAVNHGKALLTSSTLCTLRFGQHQNSRTAKLQGFKSSGRVHYLCQCEVSLKDIHHVDGQSYIASYGKISWYSGAGVTIENSSFIFNNEGEVSSSMIFRGLSRFTITGCSFFVRCSGASAGIITSSGSSATISGSIFSSDNESAINSSFIDADDADNSCFFQVDETSGGTNNVFTNPKFINVSSGDLELRPNSPLIGGIKEAESGVIYVFNGTQGVGADGTYDNPYDLADIASAEAAAGAGGTIVFKDGTYTLTGHLALGASLTSESITYKPENDESVHITGEYGLRLANYSYTGTLLLKGLKFTIGSLGQSHSYQVRIMTASSGLLKVQDCNFKISIKGAGHYYGLIGDNVVRANLAEGSGTYDEGANLTMEGCVILADIANGASTLYHTCPNFFNRARSGFASDGFRAQNITIKSCTLLNPKDENCGFALYNQGSATLNSPHSDVTADKCIIDNAQSTNNYWSHPTNIGTPPNNWLITNSNQRGFGASNGHVTLTNVANHNPLYVDSASDNLELRPTSPLIGGIATEDTTSMWVDPTSGNDANNGSTKALAKKTFASAESAASANQTIKVVSGTHLMNGNSNITSNALVLANVTKGLTYEGEDEDTILDFTGITQTNPPGCLVVGKKTNGNDITIKKLQFNNMTIGNTNRALINIGTSSLNRIIFDNCKFLNMNNSLALPNSTKLIGLRPDAGIHGGNATDSNWTFQNCIFTTLSGGQSEQNVFFEKSGTSATSKLINCTVLCRADFIDLFSSHVDYMHSKNCIFYSSSTGGGTNEANIGALAGTKTNVFYSFNDVTDTSLGTVYSVSDPLFLSLSDDKLNLRPNSPFVGKGG